VEEGVVGDDEEEGGEGTSLFDASVNIDPVCQLTPEKGGNLDRGEGPFDEVPEPRGKFSFSKDVVDPGVVDRVKGLGGVEEEEEAVKLFRDSFVKEGVNVSSVIPTIFAREETFLSRIDEVDHCSHDATSNARGEQPIVSIRDTKGTSVRHEARELFGEEEKKAEVEALRGIVTLSNSTKDVKENRSGKVRGCAPGGKRDAVRTGGRVIRTFYGLENGVQVGFVSEGHIQDPVVVFEEGRSIMTIYG
jgi:hypothetical protein